MNRRPEPSDQEHADLVFVTKYGQPFVRHGYRTRGEDGRDVKVSMSDGVAQEINKALRRIGIKRQGLNFYALRHTFQTVAEETLDFPAVHRIMGHDDQCTDLPA